MPCSKPVCASRLAPKARTHPAPESWSSTFDILGLGCTAVDDLLYVEHYPAADSKVRIRRQERQGGGLTGTALVAAARMGARCQYAGGLGQR